MKITDIVIMEGLDEITITGLKVWLSMHKEAKLPPKSITYEKFTKAKRDISRLLSSDTITLHKTIFLSGANDDVAEAIRNRSGDFGLGWQVEPKLTAPKRNPRILVANVKKTSIDLLASISGMMQDPNKNELKITNNEHVTIIDVLDATTKKSINKLTMVVKI